MSFANITSGSGKNVCCVVFGFLEPNERARLATVCSSWNKIVQNLTNFKTIPTPISKEIYKFASISTKDFKVLFRTELSDNTRLRSLLIQGIVRAIDPQQTRELNLFLATHPDFDFAFFFKEFETDTVDISPSHFSHNQRTNHQRVEAFATPPAHQSLIDEIYKLKKFTLHDLSANDVKQKILRQIHSLQKKYPSQIDHFIEKPKLFKIFYEIFMSICAHGEKRVQARTPNPRLSVEIEDKEEEKEVPYIKLQPSPGRKRTFSVRFAHPGGMPPPFSSSQTPSPHRQTSD